MDISKLKGSVPDNVISELAIASSKFKINTPLRVAHFLSQCAHESGGFKFISENLNYSAKGLLVTFPKYFTGATAAQYERNPQKIASKVYANRMGNGSEESEDGWKFRGRGYIQLTGKNNYTTFDKFVDDDILDNPDLVANKFPLLSASWFWDTNGINSIADGGKDIVTVTAVTRRVNGGKIGLEDRIAKFNKFIALLS